MVGARAVRRLDLSEWMSRRGVLGALGGAERSRTGGGAARRGVGGLGGVGGGEGYGEEDCGWGWVSGWCCRERVFRAYGVRIRRHRAV